MARQYRFACEDGDVMARPEVIKDPDEIERLLAVMAAANHSINAFIRIPKGPYGRLEHVVLRL
jgi:hypothetical protein